ncbi:hypothetical protein B9Z55_015857 [Caenorhabditis nigoni]|uniref:Uncharacterized protein n=1 Tax=Caenorhabditis nigoni TaxID=1611254 RepID=A0A2G5UCM5_9PELO|nr:hypothetical protein B9Z55_015857 [Caenorhabditis nigoni]
MFPNVAGGGPDPAHALDAPMEDIVSGHVGQSVEVSVVTIRKWIKSRRRTEMQITESCKCDAPCSDFQQKNATKKDFVGSKG